MRWMSSPGPARQVTDKEIIAAIKGIDDPFASTMEIADSVGLGRQGTLDRLQQLCDKGVVASKKAGNGIGWWVP